MYTSLKTPFRNPFVIPATLFWLLPVCAIFFARCQAQQLSLLSGPAERSQMAWTSGPADASLGKLADIKIPKGYRFTDATGAAALLKMDESSSPRTGGRCCAPESGQWSVVAGI